MKKERKKKFVKNEVSEIQNSEAQEWIYLNNPSNLNYIRFGDHGSSTRHSLVT